MLKFIMGIVSWFGAFFRTRSSPALEILALRQQLSGLKRKNPRPRLSLWDQAFWVFLRRVWSRWAEVLEVVKPETVIPWHHAGFRLYWWFLSRRRVKGRPEISAEVRCVVERMAKEYLTWGPPRIHGELLKLGFDISERTVSRYLLRVGRNRDPRKLWLVFLRNHRQVIAAMDFSTVPTATFRVLYCFFVISHSRRKILHFNATEYPTSPWVGQQLREVYPDDTAPRYLILDRDRKYEGEATEVLQSLRSELVRISYQSPWQNGGPKDE
jgi:putative transposase